jgi:hypothetical protein
MDTEAKQVTEASSMSLQEVYDKSSSLLDIDTTLDMIMPSNRRVKTCYEIFYIPAGVEQYVITVWNSQVYQRRPLNQGR